MGTTLSVYARFFDKTSTCWSRKKEYNQLFLLCQQNYWNDKLVDRGHVFLNEIYESLGIPHSKSGTVMGWVYRSGSVIDFGLGEDIKEGAILLDFNVSANVHDYLED